MAHLCRTQTAYYSNDLGPIYVPRQTSTHVFERMHNTHCTDTSAGLTWVPGGDPMDCLLFFYKAQSMFEICRRGPSYYCCINSRYANTTMLIYTYTLQTNVIVPGYLCCMNTQAVYTSTWIYLDGRFDRIGLESCIVDLLRIALRASAETWYFSVSVISTFFGLYSCRFTPTQFVCVRSSG